MIYEVVEDRHRRGDWRVEAINYGPPLGNGDGEGYIAIFTGQKSEGRAREYAIWKGQTEQVRVPV